MYDSKEILVLMVGYIFFFSWVGVRLFRGTIEGEKYFSTLAEGLWNLMVLLTTANFPDVMLPAYTANKAYCLFFMLYLSMGLFFMMNLILATFYSNYKNRVEEKIENFMEGRKQYLVSRFNCHDLHKKGFLTPDQFKELAKEFIKFNKKSKNQELDIQKISEMFDINNDGKIT